MIAVGSCIGSGIFLTPSQVAGHLSSPILILAVWALGGLYALCGSLTFSELGGMFKKAGGIYEYLKEAYGDLAGFWYGWAYFTVINSGSLAALSLAFAYYVAFLFPMGESAQTWTAVAALLGVTTINIFRVKLVEIFADLFTVMKLAGIGAVILIGLVFGSSAELSESTLAVAQTSNTWGGFGLAMIGVIFSYGGWHHATFLAGEAKNPTRNIPRAMIYGAIIVTITYLLVNFAYMRLLTVAEIAGSTKVAADALQTVIPFGAKLIAIIIAVSTLGTCLIYTLSAPRIYFAMAEDGLFFKKFAWVHPKFNTPVVSVIFQSAWAIALILMWKTFVRVITYVTFTDTILFTAAAAVVIVLRFKRPDTERPVRVFAYPIPPLVYLTVSILFILNTIIERPVEALGAASLLALGLPFYFYFKTKKNREHG